MDFHHYSIPYFVINLNYKNVDICTPILNLFESSMIRSRPCPLLNKLNVLMEIVYGLQARLVKVWWDWFIGVKFRLFLIIKRGKLDWLLRIEMFR